MVDYHKILEGVSKGNDMGDRAHAKAQAQQKALMELSSKHSLLQRTCACGQHTIAGDECEACSNGHLTLRNSQRTLGPPSTLPQGNGASVNSGSGGVSHFGHDFGRMPVYSSHSPALQTKLTINQPGDVYEREADQIAEQVKRMTHPEASMPDDEDETKNSLMPKQSKGLGADAATESSDVPPLVHTVLSSGGGHPLDMATRAFMEPRFGHDFSKVRVYTDDRASESARSVNALAYTVGQNVVFGIGQYHPGTSAGQRLLAHELTHVVQQGFGRLMVQRVALNDKDYNALAAQIDAALVKPKVDEEAVYVGLQKLEKDASAISELNKAYKKKFKGSLEAAIREKMHGEKLRLALDLLGVKVTPKAGEMVGTIPSTSDEYKTAATNLNADLKGGAVNKEAIYSVLIPFKRDATALQNLKDTYQSELSGGITGKGLEEDIKAKMSKDALAYALYLLNAPPPAREKTTATVNVPGTEAATGKVGGGDVSVHTGTKYTPVGTAATRTEGFSIGYEGGLAKESNWLQFIWREVVVTHPTKGTYRNSSPITTLGGSYSLTTDPAKPNYNVDSARTANPFYEAGFFSNRTAEATTIFDQPTAMTPIVTAEFAGGATQVISRAHFNTYLIRDYKTLYHVSLQVEWTFTSPTVPPSVQDVKAAEKVDSLPEDMKKTLVARYPKFAYIE